MPKDRISYQTISREFRAEGDPAIAEHSSRFFKTGPGEYGEGDRFLGIRVPVTRRYAKKYLAAPLSVVRRLLTSQFHEERLLAAILLVGKFKSGSQPEQKTVFDLYLDHTRYINNWDIVDTSAPHIVGPHLQNRDRTVLIRLANSTVLWERRIALMATLHYIRQHDFDLTLRLCERLLGDGHDLIHKAAGWMLREIGKRDLAVEEAFLHRHYQRMPRTMLRYAIERFPASRRTLYLEGRV